ncbi:hypothetical protein niasHT_012894 [Heterodera trifolii]|uniref:ZP domain-containing protein n=1 Tax=Heterodera trifolii TaxID=157864 RepID=A0ABD2KYI6_9BILA
MAHALMPTLANAAHPPMELIETEQHPRALIKFAMDSSENEMPNKKPIELPMSRFAEPECSYEVHLDSADGPLVDRKITIGEQLFHRWECGYGAELNKEPSPFKNSSDNSLYCMMVHSCTISSGNQSDQSGQRKHRRRNRRQNEFVVLEIMDEFGCSIYTNITPEIHYIGDLRAVLEVQAFALDYDQPAVFFKCNVRLLLKINGRCRRPNCIKK